MQRFSVIFASIVFSVVLGWQSAEAAPILVGINAGIYAEEQTQLQNSLTALGFTTVVKAVGDYTGIDVFLSYPGGSDTGPSLAQIAAGLDYVQISDWGSNWTPNSFNFIAGAPITIQADAVHPITTGVSGSWTTEGFFQYGGSTYYGWSTNTALPSLATNVTYSQSRTLVADDIGVGRAVYIGWNVYGSAATSQDLSILQNSLTWAATGQVTATSVPEPASMLLLGAGLGAVGLRRWWQQRA